LLIQEYSRSTFCDLKTKKGEGTSDGIVHCQPLLFSSFKTRVSAYNETAVDFLAMLGNILQGGCIAQQFDETGLYAI
jgi:hypothetical protein